MRADTTVEEDSLRHKGLLVNLFVEQEVQVTFNQALLWTLTTDRAVDFHLFASSLYLLSAKLAESRIDGSLCISGGLRSRLLNIRKCRRVNLRLISWLFGLRLGTRGFLGRCVKEVLLVRTGD